MTREATTTTGRTQPRTDDPAAGGGRQTRRRKAPGKALTLGAYRRVSRQGERADERFRSPTFQRELLDHWASGEGHALRHFKAEVDVSGSKPKRAVLDQIIAAIERGELDGIAVPKLNRLARLRPKDRVELFDRIERAGGVVLSASENIDASTPEGRFTLEVFLGIARMEWEQKAEAFAIAKENAVELGIAIKARAPFGYRFDARHALEVVEDDALVVRELFELRLGGACYGDALAHFERATGRSSYRTTMRTILENRAYLGELHYGRETPLVKLDAHDAIVDLELFDAVQAINGERSPGRGVAVGKAKSLLAGIVKCQGCGRGLVCSSTGRARRLSYKCPADTRHCPARASVLAEELDAHVIERVLAWAGPIADDEVEVELEREPRDRTHAELRLAEAEASLLAWSDRPRAAGSESGAAYAAGLAAREERVELRRNELAALGQASELDAARSSIREALEGDELETAEKRRLLSVVLAAVVARKVPRLTPVADRVELIFASSAPDAIAEDELELVAQASA